MEPNCEFKIYYFNYGPKCYSVFKPEHVYDIVDEVIDDRKEVSAAVNFANRASIGDEFESEKIKIRVVEAEDFGF